MLSVISVARNAVVLQFPDRQPRALQERPRLVREDVDVLARFHRRADHAERGAVSGGRQRAGVAMRQHRPAVGNQRRAMPADRAVDLDIFLAHQLRFGDQAIANLLPAADGGPSRKAASSARWPRTD